jgi:hypothetical protein
MREAAANAPETDAWLDSLEDPPTPEEIYERFSCRPPKRPRVPPEFPFAGFGAVPGEGEHEAAGTVIPSQAASKLMEA